VRLVPAADEGTLEVRLRAEDAPPSAPPSGLVAGLVHRARRWSQGRDALSDAKRALLDEKHTGEVELDGSTVVVRLRRLPSPEWLARAVAFAAARE
jgi:hypothetical protein